MNRRLARSGGRVRVGHRRWVWVVNMRLARGRHKLGLSGMDGRASGRRVLGVRAIRRGSRVMRVWWRVRRRIGVGMRRRMCRVNSLAGHIVVHGAFDGTSNSRPSRRRIGCPPRLGREMDAIANAIEMSATIDAERRPKQKKIDVGNERSSWERLTGHGDTNDGNHCGELSGATQKE